MHLLFLEEKRDPYALLYNLVVCDDQSHHAGVLHLDAHDNSLRSISLSDKGSILATVSEKGTLIRLYNADNGNRVQVLRRGIDKASVPFLVYGFYSCIQ